MANSDKNISSAVIKRLPRYFRYLGALKAKNITRISSKELSEQMMVTASQIRQDLNNFGGFGQQGYGYNVDNLYTEIGKILGLDKRNDMIIVGAGNLGQALANYQSFNEDYGYKVMAPIDLHLPDNVTVENVHLAESLMTLTYNVHNREESENE